MIGPYSNDGHVRETLGFAWPAERRTSIDRSDGVSLLLFVRDGRVVEYAKHPRHHGDFAGLDGRCFDRNRAVFTRVSGKADDWSQLMQAQQE